jgi:hypothetical protein
MLPPSQVQQQSSLGLAYNVTGIWVGLTWAEERQRNILLRRHQLRHIPMQALLTFAEIARHTVKLLTVDLPRVINKGHDRREYSAVHIRREYIAGVLLAAVVAYWFSDNPGLSFLAALLSLSFGVIIYRYPAGVLGAAVLGYLFSGPRPGHWFQARCSQVFGRGWCAFEFRSKVFVVAAIFGSVIGMSMCWYACRARAVRARLFAGFRLKRGAARAPPRPQSKSKDAGASGQPKEEAPPAEAQVPAKLGVSANPKLCSALVLHASAMASHRQLDSKPPSQIGRPKVVLLPSPSAQSQGKVLSQCYLNTSWWQPPSWSCAHRPAQSSLPLLQAAVLVTWPEATDGHRVMTRAYLCTMVSGGEARPVCMRRGS